MTSSASFRIASALHGSGAGVGVGVGVGKAVGVGSKNFVNGVHATKTSRAQIIAINKDGLDIMNAFLGENEILVRCVSLHSECNERSKNPAIRLADLET